MSYKYDIYFCFFNRISNFLNALNHINSYGLKVTTPNIFVLLEPIKCGSKSIIIPKNKAIYGFGFAIKSNYLEILPNIMKQDCFKDVILCSGENIEYEASYYGPELPQAKYFPKTSFFGLVIFAYNNNLFTLENLPVDTQKDVKEILDTDPSIYTF